MATVDSRQNSSYGLTDQDGNGSTLVNTIIQTNEHFLNGTLLNRAFVSVPPEQENTLLKLIYFTH